MNLNFNFLEIAVIVITAALALEGFRRGFALRLASMLSLVISITLVSAFLPKITEFIKTETPVYEYIVKQCHRVVAEELVDSYLEENGLSLDSDKNSGSAKTTQGTGSAQQATTTFNLNLAASGIDLSNLGIPLSQIEEYKEEILDRIKPTKVQQNAFIENLPIPERLRSMLLDYNNEEGYKRLNVSTFQDYIVNFIATGILNVISYIVCILLVQLILKAIFTALNIISHIPVIGFVNRILGLGLGLVQALFLLWLFFLVLSMTLTVPISLQLFNMVEESTFLSYLYDSNLFVKLALSAAAIFI